MKIKVLVCMCFVMSVATRAVSQQPASRPAGPAKISGVITDGTSPLVGVGVTILDTGFKPVSNTLTEQDGKYEIGGLIARKEYWIKVCHDDYTPAFKTITVPTTADMKLSKRWATAAYWNEKTNDLIAGNAPSPEEYAKAWKEFEASAVSPEGKAYVAHYLKERGVKPELWDKDLHTSQLQFMAYANADPATLKDVERKIWSDSSDPTLSKLDPIIVGDIRTGKAKWQKVHGTASPADPCGQP